MSCLCQCPLHSRVLCIDSVYLFFNFPRGATKVIGALGRSPGTMGLAGEVSFFGFLDILLLRCSPLAMGFPC